MTDGSQPDADASSAGARIAQLFTSRAEVITERWAARVAELPAAKGLSHDELVDSMPKVLQTLEQRLREQPGAVERCLREAAKLASEHGEQRFRVGFSLDAMTQEYLLLRDELLRVAQSEIHATLAETMRPVTDFVMLSLAEATQAFARCRERVASDETERQRQEHHRQFRELFGLMPFHAALTSGPEHHIELLSEPLRALWGGRNPIGVPHHQAYPELGREHYDRWDHVYRTGEPFQAQAVPALVDRGDGHPEEMHFDMRLLPRRDADGNVIGLAVFAIDVTDRQRAEEELRRRITFEQQILGVVSHDLRSPLSAVLYGVQALVRRTDVPDAVVRTLLRVQTSAERAVRLVRDLLDFSAVRLSGGVQLRCEPLDLHELCNRAVEELRMSHPMRTITVSAQGDLTGTWDPDRLSQVFGNLVSNALKYSAEGTPVTVDLRGDQDDVEIAVHNFGEAITPELRQRIFEPMQRGVTAPTDAGRSLGLGLFIVRHLVAAHGGTVAVDSSAEAGTTFRVRLARHSPSC